MARYKGCQSLQDAIKRIGFISNPNQERRIKPGPVTGIGDKTRWTKALGKAATVVYGDCKKKTWAEHGYTGMGDAVIRETLR